MTDMHDLEEQLDGLDQMPIPPLYELACCLVGLLLVVRRLTEEMDSQ